MQDQAQPNVTQGLAGVYGYLYSLEANSSAVISL